jgi:alanine racemase
MTRPTKARIDLSALRHNHAVARRHAGGAHLWAVIKANGYGHGALRMAQGLDTAADPADGFALIELDIAIGLRNAGIRQPILLLEGFYAADELDACAQYQLTPVLHRLDQVETLARGNGRYDSVPVYLKLNTGMNRLGLDVDGLKVALDLLRAHKAGVTLMTHFADADEASGIASQLDRFTALKGQLPYPTSLANSAALLRYPESCGDWVRPGIMLYGSSPFPQMHSAAELGLRPVMTLESELIAVRKLHKGDRVGYGGAFVASRAMRIGVVACGYGDGYPRHAPSGTSINVDGVRTGTVGRVSMDKICVDLSGISKARVGSLVTLWGGSGKNYVSADDVATAAGTVSYELFCALAARVTVVEEG